eukprot:5316546-Amphidinium_carterae.1
MRNRIEGMGTSPKAQKLQSQAAIAESLASEVPKLKFELEHYQSAEARRSMCVQSGLVNSDCACGQKLGREKTSLQSQTASRSNVEAFVPDAKSRSSLRHKTQARDSELCQKGENSRSEEAKPRPSLVTFAMSVRFIA